MKWYVLTGIAVAGTATVAGLGWYIWNKKKELDSGDTENRFAFDSPIQPEKKNAVYSTPVQPIKSGFPLRRGSRGEFVTNLQNALIKKFGATALPKYGADGDFGSETEKALIANGLKTVIDQTTYTDYITGNFGASVSTSSSSTPPDNSPTPSGDGNVWTQLGRDLRKAAQAYNLDQVLMYLKKIKSITYYQPANEGFKEADLKSGTTYSIVNGLLTMFQDKAEKEQLRVEFRRIGLKEKVINKDPNNYQSSWSLSGLSDAHKHIRTRMEALITDGFSIKLRVPARTLLGQWLSSGNGYTRFMSADGRELYVRSNAIVFAD